MKLDHQLRVADLPDSAHARQLSAGFPWLTFSAELEHEYRRLHLDEHVGRIRMSLFIAGIILIALAAMDALMIGPPLSRAVNIVHFAGMLPLILLVLLVSRSTQRDRLYPLVTMAAAVLIGIGAVIVLMLASRAGVTILFSGLVITVMYIYFLAGLLLYQSVGVNLVILLAYVGAAIALSLPIREFGYNTVVLVFANVVGAAVAFANEKMSRMRFLESGMLREMVARDGLTGIHNRRMFDQHIHKLWQQALRERQRVAVLLVDIDCFKDYNDFYGHQAGDECLRAVALTLNQCARRPLDFVARYGGEEFAVILYQATREYVAEVLTRIQRSIAELNIPHEASRVAGRLTVSIGAAYVLPGADRTQEGLIQLADEALYGAKAQGRNCVIVMESEYHNMKTGKFQRRSGAQAV